jgi:hypothetical protein
MSNLVTVESNHLLDATWGTSAYTNPTATVKVRLTTTTGSASSAGTEVTGGSYAAQAVTMGAAAAAANANTGALTYTVMPACTVTAVEQWDGAGTSIRRWFGALSASKTTNAGDTFSIAIAALTSTLS